MAYIDKISLYRPLIIIISVIFLAALALYAGGFSFMHGFMGLFFIFFALFKLFDIRGFANGFAKYDLISARIRAYAQIYPYLELLLGLAYLSFWQPELTYLLTVILMAVSAIGVIRSVMAGKTHSCACLGSLLNVPLSSVSIVENVGMGVMAAYMLLTL